MRTKHNDITIKLGNAKLNIVFARPAVVVGPPDNKSLFHSHPHFELYIIEYGSGHIALPDLKPIKLSRNTAILVPPGMLHERYHLPDTTSRLMVVNFDYSKINPKISDTINEYMDYFFKDTQNVLVLKDKYFSHFINNIVSQYEAEPTLANLLISNIFEGLFLHILRICHRQNTEAEPVWIYEYKSAAIKNKVTIAKEIDDYISHPDCSLQSLAAHLDMSVRNTQRIIKNIYGCNYSEVLAERRLKLALEYMKEKKYSMNDISQMVGYNQYASFRKAFILKYGVSPQTYSKKYL